MLEWYLINVFGIPRNHYLNQEAVPRSNYSSHFSVQLKIIDLAQKGGAQAPFALPLPTGLMGNAHTMGNVMHVATYHV